VTPQRPDPRLERPQVRHLLIGIALAIIALSSALGIAYVGLWQRASEDLTRLLPATTRAYAQVSAPWASMLRALRRTPWRDLGTMREQLQRDGYLAGAPSGDLAGLPLDIIRDTLRAASSLEIAVVPSGAGDTVMAFVELSDAPQRRRILSRLRPTLETIDRHAGFRIDRVRANEWSRYLGYSPLRPMFVEMSPWIIFSWGNAQGLEDLLDARVGGIHESIHRRPGFVERNASDAPRPLRVAIDAASAWRLVSDEPTPRAGGIVEQLDLLTFEHRSDGLRDYLSIDAELSDATFASTLGGTLAPIAVRDPLEGHGPADAIAALSFSSPRLDSLVQTLSLVDFALRRDFAPSARLSGLSTALRTASERLPPAPVEIAIFALPEPSGETRPLVMVRTASPEALDEALVAHWPPLFGDGFAHGELTVAGSVIRVERPEFTDATDSDGVAWRLRNGILEFALTPATLLRSDAAQGRLADMPTFAQATRELPPSSAVRLFAPTEALERLGPLGRLLSARLAPKHWLGLGLDVVGDHLEVRATLGLWPLIATLASASRDELDALTLATLTPPCAARMAAFCTLYPGAFPCRPLATDRIAHIQEVCGDANSAP
jgi:hypothetical protein